MVLCLWQTALRSCANDESWMFSNTCWLNGATAAEARSVSCDVVYLWSTWNHNQKMLSKINSQKYSSNLKKNEGKYSKWSKVCRHLDTLQGDTTKWFVRATSHSYIYLTEWKTLHADVTGLTFINFITFIYIVFSSFFKINFCNIIQSHNIHATIRFFCLSPKRR